MNRLRKEYRPDLPTYSIPKNAQSLKLTGCLTLHEPGIKPPFRKKGLNQKRGLKRPLAGNDNTKPAKKMHTETRSIKSKSMDDEYVPSKKVCVAPNSDVCVTREDPPGTCQRNYVYNPGNAETQRFWCGVLNLTYVKAVRPRLGSPTTPLTCPNRVFNVPGDGNCLFSAFSYIITGSVVQCVLL